MRSSIGKWLLGLLCAFLLICLSTALIQTTEPEMEAGLPAQAMLPPMLRPATMPAPDSQSDLPQGPEVARYAAAPPSPRAFACAEPPRHTDANGHVLRHRQYVYSVYQTFRQETACG